MIGNNFTLSAREAWATVPGNDVNITNDANGKPLQYDFVSNNVIIFSQVLTYDANGALIKISCVEPSNS